MNIQKILQKCFREGTNGFNILAFILILIFGLIALILLLKKESTISILDSTMPDIDEYLRNENKYK